jgi:hypothetical protein
MTLFSDVAVRLIQTTCTDIINGAENRNSSTTVKTANWAASLFNTSVVNTELSKEKCRLLEELIAEVDAIKISFNDDDDKTQKTLEDLITKYIAEVITATEMPSLTHSNEPLRGETEKWLEHLRSSLIDTKHRLVKLKFPTEDELLARSEFHTLIGLYYARRIYREKIIPKEAETPFFKAQKKLINDTCRSYRATIKDEDQKAISIFGDEAKKHPYHQSKVNKDIECLVRKLEKEHLKLIETLKPSSLSGIIFKDSTTDFARMLDTDTCINTLENLSSQTTKEYVDSERADAMSTTSSMSGQPYTQTTSTDELRRKLSALPYHVRNAFSRNSTSERPASVTAQKEPSAAITKPAEVTQIDDDHATSKPDTQRPTHVKNTVNKTEPAPPELPCILTKKEPPPQITSAEDAIKPQSHEEALADNLELCLQQEPIDETAPVDEEVNRDLALEPASSTASMFQHLLAPSDAIATHPTQEKPVPEVAQSEPPLLSKKALKKLEKQRREAESASNEAHAESKTPSPFA